MRRHNRLLFRSARGLVSDGAEARDVVQQTCLRAFPPMHSSRADAALGSWLARTAINVALDAQRRSGSAVQFDDTQDLGTEPAMHHMMAFNAPADDAPDTQSERSQMRALLALCVGAQTPRRH